MLSFFHGVLRNSDRNVRGWEGGVEGLCFCLHIALWGEQRGGEWGILQVFVEGIVFICPADKTPCSLLRKVLTLIVIWKQF